MKLKVYADGSRYIEGGLASFTPSGVEPVVEYDISDLNKVEVEELRENPNNQKLLKKARKL